MTAETITVLADTFALIAWLNPRDEAHALVTGYLDGFTGRLVTTEWVLMELADALSAPAARSTAVAFLQAVRPGAGRGKKPPKDENISSFSEDAAAKTGETRRTVELCAKIGGDITQEARDLVRVTKSKKPPRACTRGG
jgi:hypothetical protein